MPSTYTTNLGIEKIATGEQSGTWGTTTNTNFDLIDTAVNGIVSVTLASAGTSGSPNDLPITDGTASNGRNKFIEFVDGGDLGATAYVQLTPNDAEKIVHIRNSLSGSRSIIVFQGTYNASNDFEIPNGADVTLKFNGGGTGATVTDVNVDLTVTGATITTADINGGTIDGTVIGGSSAAAGTFTTFTSTGIDDNATSTAITISSSEYLGIGTTTPEVLTHLKSADNTIFQLESTDANVYMKMVDSNTTGAGYIGYETNDMTFWANNAERVRIDSSGNVGIGTTSPNDTNGFSRALDVNGVNGAALYTRTNGSTTNQTLFGNFGDSGYINNKGSGSLLFYNNNNTERMRIDSAGNVGIGTTSPDAPLHIQTASGSKSEINLGQTAVTNYRISIPASTDALTFVYGASTERMRIDAGGSVLIGKTTPADLHNTWNHLIIGEKGAIISENGAGGIDGITISDNAYIDADTGSYAYQTTAAASLINQSGGNIVFSNAGSGTAGTGLSFTERMRIDSSGNVDVNGDFYVGSSNNIIYESGTTFNVRAAVANLTFQTNGANERMRIDSSGNVGIGTASPSHKLEVVGRIQTDTLAVDTAGGTDSGFLGGRSDWTGGATDNSFTIGSYQPNLCFFTNNNGTTERMRIDSSGNVGIGTTSPGYKLHVDGEVYSAGRSTGYGYRLPDWRMYNETDNSIVWTSGSNERMRIDSSGNVGIGTASPARELVVYHATQPNIVLQNSTSGVGVTDGFQLNFDGNAYVWNYEISPMLFGTSNTERMRIDSSGNLLVGKTSATLSASGMMVIAGNSMTLTIASGTTYHLHDGLNYKFYVNANGGIYNYQANDVNLSDQRVKKDIVDSGNYLEKLCNIPVRNFRYNEDAEDGKHHLGVIAQEVEAVAPEFVNKASWEHTDGQMDTVYNTDLMFAMMKSIQELSAQVNELKAEVAALKGA